MRSTTSHRGSLYAVLGVAAILVVWELLSLVVNPAIMASPVDTARALADLAWGSKLWVELLITLKRLVIGLAIGAGVTAAVAATAVYVSEDYGTTWARECSQ